MRALLPRLLLWLIVSGCASPGAGEADPAAGGLELLPTSGDAVVAPPPEVQPASAESVPAGEPATPTAEASPPPASAVDASAPALPAGAGRIVRVNEKLGYVLIEGGGRLAPGQQAIALREGAPVARLRISHPRLRHFFSADIEDGEPRVGDVVR
jgi:hypothetical protein